MKILFFKSNSGLVKYKFKNRTRFHVKCILILKILLLFLSSYFDWFKVQDLNIVNKTIILKYIQK